MNTEQTRPITDDVLQAYLDGEITEAEHEAIAASIAQEPDHQESMAALDALHQQLHEGLEALEPPTQPDQTDASRALARLRQQLAQRSQITTNEAPKDQAEATPDKGWLSWRRLLQQPWGWGAMATAALLIALQLPISWTRQHTTARHQTAPDALHSTMKHGQPQFAVFLARQRPGASKNAPPSARYFPTQQLRSGAKAAPGDLLQFALRLPHESHCLIISINQRGALFVYLPLEKERSVKLPAGEHLYPSKGSMELDQSPGKERLFAFFGQHPLPVSMIKQLLQVQFQQTSDSTSPSAALEALKAPKGPWTSQSVWFDKGQKKP